MARIDRLVARRIGGVGGTRDVRRQRHVAVTVEIIEKRPGALEPQTEEPSIALDDGRLRVARQQQFSSRFRRMAGAKLEHRLVRRHLALEQELHSAAGRPPRAEARLDHPRVVEHQQIVLRNEPRKIREREIVERRSIHMQQAAAGACRRPASAR